jgi:DNA-binding MltR family transcriptional regulator
VKLRSAEEVNRLKDEFFASLKAESDRGCVLVGAAFLDEGLELLLRSTMLNDPGVMKQCIDPLFTGRGPFRSFWAKTQMCRALDLIKDWEYEDLGRIRTLRNRFAHSYEDADFGNPEVLSLTSQLQQGLWAKAATALTRGNSADSAALELKEKSAQADVKRGRLYFMLSTGYLAGSLHLRAGI